MKPSAGYPAVATAAFFGTDNARVTWEHRAGRHGSRHPSCRWFGREFSTISGCNEHSYSIDCNEKFLLRVSHRRIRDPKPGGSSRPLLLRLRYRTS